MKALTLTALLLFAVPLAAEDLASVGSERVSREEFEAAAQAEAAALKRELSREERVALLRSMANQRLLVLEARRRKLDKLPAVRDALSAYERRVLSEAAYNELIASKAGVSAQEARQFYDQNPALFDVAEISQIVVAPGKDAAASEKKAAALAARMKAAPKAFAATAKKESDDELSRGRGGDVGALRRGMLLPELEAAAFGAKSGAVLGPIRTQFGWHILHVRSLKRLSWDQAGAGLQQELQRLRAQQLQQGILEEAAKRSKVKLAEDKL